MGLIDNLVSTVIKSVQSQPSKQWNGATATKKTTPKAAPKPQPVLPAPIKEQIATLPAPVQQAINNQVVKQQQQEVKQSNGFIKNVVLSAVPQKQLAQQADTLFKSGNEKAAGQMLKIIEQRDKGSFKPATATTKKVPTLIQKLGNAAISPAESVLAVKNILAGLNPLNKINQMKDKSVGKLAQRKDTVVPDIRRATELSQQRLSTGPQLQAPVETKEGKMNTFIFDKLESFKAATEINESKKNWMADKLKLPEMAKENMSLNDLKELMKPAEYTKLAGDYDKAAEAAAFLSRVAESGTAAPNDFKILTNLIEGSISGMTFRISDQLKKKFGGDMYTENGMMMYKGIPIGKEFNATAAEDSLANYISPEAATLMGQIAGSVPTYFGISRGVGNVLIKNSEKIAKFAERNPFLFGAGISNPIEESVEYGVRKGTGQTYGVKDFLLGIVAGAGFEGFASGLGKLAKQNIPQSVLDQADDMIRAATESKKAPLTTPEVESIFHNIPIKNNWTLGDSFRERKLAYLKTPESIMGMKRTDPLDTETIFNESSIISPAERAVMTSQAVEMEIALPLKKLDNEMVKMGEAMKSPEVKTAIFNSIDNPSKYFTDPQFIESFGPIRQSIIDLTTKWTKIQQKAGTLDEALKDDEYLRQFLIKPDGSPLDATDLMMLRRASEKNKAKFTRLMAMEYSGGQGGIGNKYNQERKFQNADERDAWLKEMGVNAITDRDVVRVLAKTKDSMTDLVSRMTILKTIRDQAKQRISKAGKEIYDPAEFRALRDSQRDVVRNLRNDFLFEAKQMKFLSDAEYVDAKKITNDIIDKAKQELKSLDEPGVAKDLEDAIDNEYKILKTTIWEFGIRTDKKFSKWLAAKRKEFNMRLNGIREAQREVLDKTINKWEDQKLALMKEGYRSLRTGNMGVDKHLEGLMYKAKDAEIIEEIFKRVKKSSGGFSQLRNSWSDVAKTWKVVTLTFDLFKVFDVLKTAVSVSGLRGLKAIGWNPLKNEADLMDAVNHGLAVTRPSDIEVKFMTNDVLGKDLVNDMEQSFAGKVIEKTFTGLGKVPVIGQIGQFAKALESIQWDKILPATKVKLYTQMWPKFKKIYKNLSEEEAKYLAAKLVNNSMQGQNWKLLQAKHPWMGKDFQGYMRFVFLGPDKLMSTLSKHFLPFTKYGAPYRRMFLRQMLMGLAMTEVANYYFNGHSSFQNIRGNEMSVQIPFLRDDTGKPMALDLAGELFSYPKMLNKPLDFFINKMHPLTKGLASIVSPSTFASTPTDDYIPLPLSVETFLKSAATKVFPSYQPSTKISDLKTASIKSSLDFLGLPSNFRKGGYIGDTGTATATLEDVYTGKASIRDWLFSQEIKMYRNPTEYKVYIDDMMQAGQMTENEAVDKMEKYLSKYKKGKEMEQAVETIMTADFKSGEEAQAFIDYVVEKYELGDGDLAMIQNAYVLTTPDGQSIRGAELDKYLKFQQEKYRVQENIIEEERAKYKAAKKKYHPPAQEGLTESQSGMLKKWINEDWTWDQQRKGIMGIL